jgi:preprotein translocase subunit SecE
MSKKQKKRQRIIQIGVVVIVSIFLLSTFLSGVAMFL